MDRCTHPAGDPSRQDVAEVAGRDAERGLLGKRLRGRHVVDDLGHHPRPVDRVHRRQLQLVSEVGVTEHRLHEVLAVVEVALDGDRVDIRAVDRGHLAALDVTGATGRIEDHDVDVLTVLDTVDRRRAGVAAGGTDDRDSLTTLGQHVVEHPTDQLQGDILERQRRAMEQLQQPLAFVDLHERHHRRVPERGVGLVAQFGQRVGGQVGGDVRCHHGGRDVGVVVDPGQVGQRRPGRRNVQATVVGEPGQQHIREPQIGGPPACRQVAHVRNRSPG